MGFAALTGAFAAWQPCCGGREYQPTLASLPAGIPFQLRDVVLHNEPSGGR
jgi:hypothetical protein